MKSYCTAIIVALSALLPLQTSAEPPEFLVPLTDSEEANARATNDYFLKKETYFAKRYGIVRVNTNLLLKADEFRITLFDDQSVTLQVSSVDVRDDGSSIGWTGKFATPGVSADELIAGGLTREEAEWLLPHSYALEPLASDPKYHVLLQLDPDKVFSKPIEPPDPNAVNAYVESPENRAKRERYRNFLDALGPDPRPSDFYKE